MGTSTDAILFWGIPLGGDDGEDVGQPTLKSWAETMGVEPDEYGYYDQNDLDWEEVFYQRTGVPDYPEGETQYKDGSTTRPPFQPRQEYDPGKYGPVGERTPEAVAKWETEWALVREARKAADETSGCEVRSHCSSDCPMYYVAVKRLHHLSYRGEVMEITPAMMLVTPEDRDKLQAFCKLMDLPWEEPKWYLVSDWG